MPRTHLSLLVALVAITLPPLVAGCGREPGEPSPAEQALAELRRQFEELKRRTSDDPVEWAREDLENIGDWEYRVVDLTDTGADALAGELNRLGNDRWEAFWVERSATGVRILLKRPSVSYIGRMPFSVIGRAVGEAGGDQ